MGTHRRVVLITPDRVADRHAGIALRHLGLARALTRCGHDVLLCSTDPASSWSGDAFAFAIATNDTVPHLLAGADACLVQGAALQGLPALLTQDVPLVVDLICPIFLENLERYRGQPGGEALLRSDHDLFREALVAGDAFLCGSETQRQFWLGMLAAHGRLTIAATDDDPGFDRRLRSVPFGVPEMAPVKRQPVLKGVVPGIGSDAVVAWWGGGLWNWLDPLTPIRALAALRPSHPELKLVFTGLRRPQDTAGLTPMARAAMALAKSLDVEQRSVFFLEGWVPGEQLGDYVLEADIGITAHRATLESRFAVRTRFWTYLWGGLPIVATAGDVTAEQVERHELGCVTPPGDVDAMAESLRRLTDPAARAQHATASRRLAAASTWDAAVASLDDLLRSGIPRGDRAARLATLPPSPRFSRAGNNLRKFGATAAAEGLPTALRRSWVKLSGRSADADA